MYCRSQYEPTTNPSAVVQECNQQKKKAHFLHISVLYLTTHKVILHYFTLRFERLVW